MFTLYGVMAELQHLDSSGASEHASGIGNLRARLAMKSCTGTDMAEIRNLHRDRLFRRIDECSIAAPFQLTAAKEARHLLRVSPDSLFLIAGPSVLSPPVAHVPNRYMSASFSGGQLSSCAVSKYASENSPTGKLLPPAR